MYDLSTEQETQITEDPDNQFGHPAISGDQIVWVDDRNPPLDIYMYDFDVGTEKLISIEPWGGNSPAISGHRIVYTDYRNLNYDIYMYDLGTEQETQITTNVNYQRYPSVSGDRVVWQDDRNGTWDIYMSILVIDNAINIIPGTGIIVDFGNGVVLEFENVETEGLVTLSIHESGPQLLAGFQIIPFDLPIYYKFTNTAEYTGTVTIHLNYDETQIGEAAEEELRLFQYERGTPNDITTAIDIEQNIITGQTSSFSLFAIGYIIPITAIQTLEIKVEELNIEQGTENSLISILQNVCQSLEKSNNNTAVNILNAFINEVAAQSGKKITENDAEGLISFAHMILNAIQGEFSNKNDISEPTIAINIPEKYELSQNYPNPFNSSTTIQFALPEESHVLLEIYNSAGQLIEILVNKNMGVGNYSINWDAAAMPSGIYFYRIKAGKFTDLKKMILLR
jgi:beta propeller repeat protein